jgi:hypothetical protein
MFVALATDGEGACELRPTSRHQPRTRTGAVQRVRRASRRSVDPGRRRTKKASPQPKTDSFRRERPPTVLIGTWSGTRSGADLIAKKARSGVTAVQRRRPRNTDDRQATRRRLTAGGPVRYLARASSHDA